MTLAVRALSLVSVLALSVDRGYAWDLAVEGDFVINGLASQGILDQQVGVDPSLNPPIAFASTWGDVAEPGAVTVPGGFGVGTDTVFDVVDVGGAGAGGGGVDGMLVYSLDATPEDNLVFDASAYELAVSLTIHAAHDNFNDAGGIPTDQQFFRVIVKDNDGIDLSLPARAREDVNYFFNITELPREERVEITMPLDMPSSYFTGRFDGAGDMTPNFDADDPFGAGTGGAYEVQLGPTWGSHGRFNITFHELAFREITAVATPGDFNADGAVDNADLNLLLGSWGDSTVPPEWVNGFVSPVDNGELNDLLSGWGTGVGTAVPEPGTALLCLVGLSSVSLCRRA